jgi:hypothetical protein
MTAQKRVHFTGIEEVINAYEHYGIPAFAIFSGKDLHFRCMPDTIEEGSKSLETFLEMLGPMNWEHLTLKVYEDTSKGIKARTDYDGSFGFQINENPNKGDGVGNNAVLSRLAAIEKKLTAEDSDDDEMNDYGLGKIGQIMQHPAIEPLVPLLTNKLLDFLIGPDPHAQTARIAGPREVTTDEQVTIDAAITRLKATTQNLGELLLKLAEFSEKQPVKFKIYMGTFKTMRF